MKKLITLFIIFLLSFSIVFAINENEVEDEITEELEVEKEEKDIEEEEEIEVEDKKDRRLRISKEDRLQGITNAITRGNKSEEVIQELREVLVKIEDKRLEQIVKLEELKIEKNVDGTIEVRGKKDAGFLWGLFRLKHQYRFEIEEDGTVKQKGWFRWMWSE